jgi:hypothetical protein
MTVKQPLTHFKNFRTESRTAEVGRAVLPAADLTPRELELGALLRIADALERVVEALDPVLREQKAAERRLLAKKQAREVAEAEQRARRDAAAEAFTSRVRQKMRALVAGCPGDASSRSVATRGLIDWVFRAEKVWEDREFGEAGERRLREIAEAFDPLTHPWETVTPGVGPVVLQRLRAMIGRMRAGAAANGVHRA